MEAGHFAPISLFRRGFYKELNSYFKKAVLMWLFKVCHVLKGCHVLTTVCCLPSCLYQCSDVAMCENGSLFKISRVGLYIYIIFIIIITQFSYCKASHMLLRILNLIFSYYLCSIIVKFIN